MQYVLFVDQFICAVLFEDSVSYGYFVESVLLILITVYECSRKKFTHCFKKQLERKKHIGVILQ